MEEIKIKISRRDQFFLANMNPKFEYIGRDKDGTLWAFQRKPSRGKDMWNLFWDFEKMKINAGLFMHIRWEDQIVYAIEQLKQLKEEEHHVTNRR